MKDHPSLDIFLKPTDKIFNDLSIRTDANDKQSKIVNIYTILL